MIKSLILILSKIVLVIIIFSLALDSSLAQLAPGRGAGVRVKTEGGKEINLYNESHALVIGISKYTHGWQDLSGVKDDVPAVKEALEKLSFKVDVEENLTGQELEAVIKRFIRKYGNSPENGLLIYFAGHGFTFTTAEGVKLGYIVPKDAPLPSANLGQFKEIAISMNQIEGYALQIESKHALFIFDSCFAGTIFDTTRGTHPPYISSMVAQPVRQFITAGTANQTVPNRSIFREQFVKGLEGDADLNRDGYITGSELGLFLQDKVTNYTKSAQTPQWGKIKYPQLDKGDFVFQLAITPGAQDGAGNNTIGPQTSDPKAIELRYWNYIKDSKNQDDFKAYLEEYPKGVYANEARNQLKLLTNTSTDATSKTDIIQRASPFHLSVTGFKNHSYNVKCVGEYKIHPKSIELIITDMTVWAVGSGNEERRELISIQFGLGVDTSDDRGWKLVSASQDYKVDKILKPGDQYSQRLVSYTIPMENGTNLPNSQLIMALKSKSRRPGENLLTYTFYVRTKTGFFEQKLQSNIADGEINLDNTGSKLPGTTTNPKTSNRVNSNDGSSNPFKGEVLSPSPIPHGPNDLEPRIVYVVGRNKTEIILRALTVDTNDDKSLNEIVSSASTELGDSGSHAWDSKWYYWRLQHGENLLLSWHASGTQGWVLAQKNLGSWWYKTNEGQWKQIKDGESKDVFWIVEGAKISITIEIPSPNTRGWTANDVKYKFGN